MKNLLLATLPENVSIPSCCLRTPAYANPLDAVVYTPHPTLPHLQIVYRLSSIRTHTHKPHSQRTNPLLTVYTPMIPCETDAAWSLRPDPIESTVRHPSYLFNKWGT